MPGITISEKKIRLCANSSAVYHRGLDYFTRSLVMDFEYDPSMLTVTANVQGNDTYQVEIVFDQVGEIDNVDCDCPAFYQYFGACKHIVAVLKAAQFNLRQVSFAKAPGKDAMDEIFNLFDYQSQFHEKKNVNLEIFLQLYKLSYHCNAYLEFKVGLERNYIVKNIKNFLETIQSDECLEFGKQFTFDPARHSFAQPELAVIQMLIEMLENEKSFQHGPYMYSYFQSKLFEGKRVLLPEPYLKRFFEIMQSKAFFLSHTGSAPELIQINQELPLEINVGIEESNLSVSTALRPGAFPVTKDGEYFYVDNTIYRLTPNQKKYFFPLFQRVFANRYDKIVFSNEYRDRFASEILPLLEETGKVNLEAGIEESLYREELTTKIYLDRAGEGITARVEFCYGDHLINPFSSAAPGENLSPANRNRIIIRDMPGEKAVLNFFEQADFLVKQGTIYLYEENQILDFITNLLPKLNELAEVYYSDDFKTLNVKTSTTVSSSIRLDHSLNLLEFSFGLDGVEQNELNDVFHSLRLKRKYHRLKDGSFLSLNQPDLIHLDNLLDNLVISPKDLKEQVMQLPAYRAFYLDNFLRHADIQKVERSQPFKHLVQSILEPQDMDFIVPEELSGILRDYQKTGFKWLKTLAAFGMGGILADDMGLGKTLQVIAFILSHKQTQEQLPDKIQPSLVVAPTSLIYNWQDEVIKFAPELKVAVICGVPAERQEQLHNLTETDLVVTSYPLIRRDIDLYKEMDFNYCFLDEAQHIKNPNTINARSVQQIKAKGYFALTGTPIENSLTELWSIFNFTMPGYLLSHKSFQKKFEIPIVKNGEPQAMVELSRHVRPFIMRRLKKEVLKELPPKIETKLTADMTSEQKKLYLAYLQQTRGDVAREIAAQGFERSQIKILAALTRLRQICCHPGMFLEGYRGDSGKMQVLQEIVADSLESGHRILLFSQFTSMLEIIRRHLTKEKIPYFYLDGSTKTQTRGEMVRSFNQGQGQVFLISLKAGGTGLNLTGADTVIHYDPWWNPAVEDQATDRAYRIGQKNMVQVIKLVTQGTIEEKIFQMQQKKKELVDSVIQPGETFLSKLTEEEIRCLFEF